MDNLRDMLRQATGVDDAFVPFSVPGTVLSVDKTAGTADVQPHDGTAPLPGVLLRADPAGGFTLYPTEGSLVLVDYISPDDAYVAMMSSIDTYELRTAAGESLKDLLVDTLQLLLDLKLQTNTGATLAVITAPSILAVQNRIKQFFNK